MQFSSNGYYQMQRQSNLAQKNHQTFARERYHYLQPFSNVRYATPATIQTCIRGEGGNRCKFGQIQATLSEMLA
jgi:hypothetical protein